MNRSLSALVFVVISSCLYASAVDDEWQKLGRVERSNAYTFLLHDGTCRVGKIKKVENDRLALESGEVVMRPAVVYVGEYGVNPHEILYSGRSSWHDVQEVGPALLEHLTVRLNSGKSMSGSFIAASDSSLTIKRFGGATTVLKQDIAEVNYVRTKPVAESHRYLAQEAPWLMFFDPKWWQYLLRIDALMSVRIYDSALPEDDSSLSCQESSPPK